MMTVDCSPMRGYIFHERTYPNAFSACKVGPAGSSMGDDSCSTVPNPEEDSTCLAFTTRLDQKISWGDFSLLDDQFGMETGAGKCSKIPGNSDDAPQKPTKRQRRSSSKSKRSSLKPVEKSMLDPESLHQQLRSTRLQLQENLRENGTGFDILFRDSPILQAGVEIHHELSKLTLGPKCNLCEERWFGVTVGPQDRLL